MKTALHHFIQLAATGDMLWYQVSRKGSHRQFKHPAKSGRVTIAGHPSEEMDEGTRKSILKQGGLKR